MPLMFVLEGALTEGECRLVQKAMDAGAAEPTEILGEDIVLAEDVRRACHVEVTAGVLKAIGQRLDGHRDAISRSLGRPLRRRVGFNLLRYDTGGFYRPHVDRGTVPSWPSAARREVTVVVFLDSSRETDPTGGFRGGVLRLHPENSAPIDVRSRRGVLVAFPAELPHEVTPVTEGRRDTVVDWFC